MILLLTAFAWQQVPVKGVEEGRAPDACLDVIHVCLLSP